MSGRKSEHQVVLDSFFRVRAEELSVQNAKKQGFLVYVEIDIGGVKVRTRRVRVCGVVTDLTVFRNGFRFYVEEGGGRVPVRGWSEHLGMVVDKNINEGDVVEIYGYPKMSYEGEVYLVPVIVVKHKDRSFLERWKRLLEEDRLYLKNVFLKGDTK